MYFDFAKARISSIGTLNTWITSFAEVRFSSLFVIQEHRRYLHVCQPRYLSFLRLWSPFPLSRISFSFPPPRTFSLSLSLPLVATLPSLFVTVSSTCSCSPAFAQALNAIYDHRYVLSRHIRSSWSLAFSPFVVLIAPLFGLLDGSLVLRTDLHVCFFRRAFDSFSSLTP